MTNTSKVLRAGLLGVLLSSFVLPVASDARPLNAKPRITIELGAGPPALRVETYGRPPSRRHVWVPGHWEWSRRAHDWVWEQGHGASSAPRPWPLGSPDLRTPRRSRWVTRRGKRDRDHDGDHDRHDHDHDNDGHHN